MKRVSLKWAVQGVVVLNLMLCAGSTEAGEPRPALGQHASRKSAAQTLEDKWGIQVESVRLSANGHMVDFRYKVLDADKAGVLGDAEATAYLVDRTTSAKLTVPSSPKVGPLRQSAERLESGKVYFTLFSNRGNAVKRGSKVTVVVGKFKAENLVVQ